MDLISTKAMEITELAMNGLSARHKVLSSNIANADTPNYVRNDVSFENQLQDILKSDTHSRINQINKMGMQLNLGATEVFSNSGKINVEKNPYADFKPQIIEDTNSAVVSNGNNVNIEKEMTELMKNGTKYNVLANIQSKKYMGLKEVLRGVQ